MSYYNTTNETGNNLKEFKAKAKNQEDRIIAVMRANPEMHYGASDLSRIFPNMLLTSIRRSLSNLSKSNLIYKTDKKQQGLFSRNEYTFMLNCKSS